MLEGLVILGVVLVSVFALIASAMTFAEAVEEHWKKSETGTSMDPMKNLQLKNEPERDGISGTVLMTKEELEVQLKAAMKRVQPNSYALADAALIQLWEKLYGSN